MDFFGNQEFVFPATLTPLIMLAVIDPTKKKKKKNSY